MAEFDSSLPKSVVQKIREDFPIPSTWNEELAALVNPSIRAEPLHAPLTGMIKKRLNNEFEYYWAYDKCGQNPNHERVEQLRAAGFDFASTSDVQMYSEDNIRGADKNGFSSEIRSGDRRLMKIRKERWHQIRKAQLMQAINMTTPRRLAYAEDRSMMSAASLVPGVRSETVDEGSIDGIRAKAVLSNAAEELATGNIKGNASRVSINKGA